MMSRKRQRLAPLGLVVLLGAACNREPPPVTVAKAFASAIQHRNPEQVLPLLDAPAREALEEAAERATDQIGGRRPVGTYEMLQIVDVDPRFQIAQATLVESDERAATVRLRGVDGTEYLLSLVHENGEWRVRVPLPQTSP